MHAMPQPTRYACKELFHMKVAFRVGNSGGKQEGERRRLLVDRGCVRDRDHKNTVSCLPSSSDLLFSK